MSALLFSLEKSWHLLVSGHHKLGIFQLCTILYDCNLSLALSFSLSLSLSLPLSLPLSPSLPPSLPLSGPSGGGKSSCISMLERFYEPQSGTVLVDGRPLSQYDHTYLHTRVSLVGQEPILYARSIAENISCHLEGTTQESIKHAAKLSNAHDFITSMTDGYDTQTGEKGKNGVSIVMRPSGQYYIIGMSYCMQVPSYQEVRNSVWRLLVL